MKKIAIVIAGGSGKRMMQKIPKQFLIVNEKPVIVYTLEAFERHPMIDAVIVVCIDGWQLTLKSYIDKYRLTKVVSIVKGGECGQASIKEGLDEARKLFSEKDMVLIHDAIRPMVSEEIISKNISKCVEYGNATVAIPCTTVVVNKTSDLYSEEMTDRDKILLTQTPQAFVLGDILEAHELAEHCGITNSVASCALYIQLGKKVYFSDGDETNIKLTRPSDLQIFRALLAIQGDM